MKINLKNALLTGTAFVALSASSIGQAQACTGGTPGNTPVSTGTYTGAGAAGGGSVDGSVGCPGGDGIDFGASGITVTGTTAYSGGAGDVGAIAAGAGNQGGLGGVGTSFNGFTGDTLNNNTSVTGGAGGAGSAGVGAAAGGNGGLGGAGIFDNSANNTINITAGGTITGGAGGAGAADATANGGAGATGGDGVDIFASGTGAILSATGAVTGGAGGAGGSSGGAGNGALTVGGVGGAGIFSVANTVNITGTTFTGGAGGAGGADSAGVIGGAGAVGGIGAEIGGTGVIFSASGIVTGGQGGAGGAGGAAANAIGGVGGAGIVDISTTSTITAAAIIGGAGGAGGASNGALGTGGDGAAGGDGADIGGTTTNFSVSGNVTGGAGGSGGASTGTANNSNGGAGGAGIHVTGTGDTITLGIGTLLQGGAAGAAGTGGTGLAGSAGATGDALDLGGTRTVVINNGTISGQILQIGNGGATITNNGTITGNLNLTGSAANTVTLTSGTVTGNLTTGAGADILNLAGGALNGNIDLAGGANVINITSNFTAGGAIDSTAGTITTNVGPGVTLTVPTYVTIAGNTLETGLTSTGSANTVGTLVSTGNVVSLAGETVKVNIIGSGVVATGAANAVILATGNAAELAADEPLNVTDNSFLYNFTVTPGSGGTANDLLLTASKTANPTTNGNNAGAAQVLLGNLAGSANPQIVQIQNNLSTASTRTAFNNVLESTLPTVDGGNMVAAIDMTDATLDMSEERIASVRTGNDTGMAAGDMTNGMGAWIKGFGQHASQNDRNDVKGYDANTWGGALGLDTANALDHGLIGIDFAYGRSDVNSRNANSTDTNIDSYQGTLYGTQYFAHDMFVNGLVAYAWDRNTTVRHDVGGVTGLDANGKYNASQWAARLATGRDFAWDGMTLTPSLVGDYLNFHPQSYTETGAGGADLNVKYGNFNQLDLGVNVKAGWTFKDANGGVTKPDLHAGYRYNVLNDNVQATSSFTAGGGAFTTDGLTPGRSIFNAGADIKFVATNRWELSGSYDFEAKSGYTSHSGIVRAGYKF